MPLAQKRAAQRRGGRKTSTRRKSHKKARCLDPFKHLKWPDWNLAYNNTDKRDLRIDYLRGIVICVVVLIHLDFFSAYNLLVWERVGVVSSAGGFVIMSGLVLGSVYGGRLQGGRASLAEVSAKICQRGVQLYLVNVVVCALIMITRPLLPFINFQKVSTFQAWSSGQTYTLVPEISWANWEAMAARVLLLKSSPHQIQVLGFYTAILFLTPAVFFLLQRKQTHVVIGLSWIIYFAGLGQNLKITGAQFEHAFPLTLWQTFFIHALIVGYHKGKIARFITEHKRIKRIGLSLAGVITLAGLYFAQIDPLDALPDWSRVPMPSWISVQEYYDIKGRYFGKAKLGILRFINYAALIICAYWALSKLWRPCHYLLGKFFIPLGQATLYVFIMHVPVVIVFDQLPALFGLHLLDRPPSYDPNTFWVNTLWHTLALLALWVMVHYRFLFRIVPR